MKVGGLRRLYIPGNLSFPKGLPSGPGRSVPWLSVHMLTASWIPAESHRAEAASFLSHAYILPELIF